MAIEAYQWPGNISQLENKIKRAVVMTDDAYVDLHDLAMQADFNAEDAAMQLNLKQVREQAETTAIKEPWFVQIIIFQKQPSYSV